MLSKVSFVTVCSCAQLLTVSAQAQTWTQVGGRLGSATQTHVSDGFGLSVALSGDTAVIGGGIAQVQSSHVPAVYIFARSGAAWAQQGAPLVSPDSADKDIGPCAVSGDTLIAISSLHAYVFTRSGSTWTQQGGALSGAPFGAGEYLQSVALSGDTAVVGGTKAAYVFVRTGGTWAQQGPALLPAGPYAYTFGISVGISGATVTVSDDANTLRLYQRSGSAWAEQGSALTSPLFNIAFSGNTLLTGEYASQEVRAYTLDASSFTPQGLFSAPSAQSGFGKSVALSGNVAVVGAPDQLNGTGLLSGAAYIYTLTGSTWTQTGPALTASKTGAADMGDLGFSVAVSGETVLVGDPQAAAIGGPGAYFFNRTCLGNTDCPISAPCEGGLCIAHCSQNTDCSAGQACAANGRCQSPAGDGGDGGAGGSDEAGGEAGNAEAGAAGHGDPIGAAGSGSEPSAGQGGRAAGGASHSGGAGVTGRGGNGGRSASAGEAGESDGSGASTSGEESTCGCRVAGRSSRGPASLGALVLLGLCWLRRRTRH